MSPCPILLIHSKTDGWLLCLLLFLELPNPIESHCWLCSDHGTTLIILATDFLVADAIDLSETYLLIPGPPLSLLAWFGHVPLLPLAVVVTASQVSLPSLVRTLAIVECFRASLELTFHTMLLFCPCMHRWHADFRIHAVISSLKSTFQHIPFLLSPPSPPWLSNWHYICN